MFSIPLFASLFINTIAQASPTQNSSCVLYVHAAAIETNETVQALKSKGYLPYIPPRGAWRNLRLAPGTLVLDWTKQGLERNAHMISTSFRIIRLTEPVETTVDGRLRNFGKHPEVVFEKSLETELECRYLQGEPGPCYVFPDHDLQRLAISEIYPEIPDSECIKQRASKN